MCSWQYIFSYELQNTAIHWIIRDVYPSSVFFLPQVSKFLEHRILKKNLRKFLLANV